MTHSNHTTNQKGNRSPPVLVLFFPIFLSPQNFFYAESHLIWGLDSCRFHSAVNDQHLCCDIVMHSCFRSVWSQYIWAIKILPIERNDREGNHAHVHLYFMILRLELIAVKNWFWTWTAASKSTRQHILKLWKLFLSQWW